ncbi:hypothetical protein J5X07_07585 [Actinomyces bowdenii]|uniref:2'-5' RNA ligase family protein n=1 Tax=Actinomyces bowdenii TaxID=131109 RepID=UPI001ABC3F1E|nr:hypothetical protein [Actinomyces bowdenii]
MEELQEFDERITSFQSDSVPDEPVFGLPASLKEKIAPGCGALQPFHGDTIAYFLDARVMGLAGAIADELHLRFGESLSQPLPAAMAHVTLHDLHASSNREQVLPVMESGTAIAARLVAQARAIGPIRAVCTAVFNLMNTSAAIGLRAANAEEHRKLVRARSLFDEMVPSGPFTPHITLAYYRPEPPVPLPPIDFRHALNELTGRIRGEPLTLAPDHLHLMRFDSMGNYWAAQR